MALVLLGCSSNQEQNQVDIERKQLFDNNWKFYLGDTVSAESKDFNDGKIASAEIALELRKIFGKRVLGPHSPLVSRVKNWYLHQIILKIEKKASFQKAKLLLKDKLDNLETREKFRKVRINIDVDPF